MRSSATAEDLPEASFAGQQETYLGVRGPEEVVRALIDQGVDVLFGYPGGANLEIFDVLQEYGLRCIRVEHEQGAAHAAEAWAPGPAKAWPWK